MYLLSMCESIHQKQTAVRLKKTKPLYHQLDMVFSTGQGMTHTKGKVLLFAIM